jgi:sulfite reductase (NADPH) hemoprotein beta-component
MACVALPTCALALTESERYLPSLIGKIDALLVEKGLGGEAINVRMTGCPNGCARPYIAEVGFVGRNPGRYNVHLGGAKDGSRVAPMVAEDVDEAGILTLLGGWFEAFAAGRQEDEGFGDFAVRVGLGAGA